MTFLTTITATSVLLGISSAPQAAAAAAPPPGGDSAEEQLAAGATGRPNRVPLFDGSALAKIKDGFVHPKAPLGVGVRILPGSLRRGSDYLVRISCPTNATAAHVISSAFNSVGQRYYRQTVLGTPILIYGLGHFPSPQPVAYDLPVGIYKVRLRCLQVLSNPLRSETRRIRKVVARSCTWIRIRKFRLDRF